MDHQPWDELAFPADDPSIEQRVAGEQQLDRLMAAIKQLPSPFSVATTIKRIQLGNFGGDVATVRLAM